MRLILLTLIAFSYAPLATAQDDAKPIVPLLWKVTKDGAPHAAFLYGTMHAGVRTDAIPATVWTRLAAAKLVYTEYDLRKKLEMQALAQGYVLLKDKTLSSLIGKEHFATALKLMKGVPPASVDRLHPAVVSAHISMLWLQGEGRGGVDDLVTAKAAGKTLRGLETGKQQLEMLFRKVPLEDSVAGLKELLADPAKAKQEALALQKAYESGDVEALTKIEVELRERPKTHAAMLVERNKDWVGQIAKAMTEGEAFVAVGALHLVGADSVVAMLEKKGYTVERVAPGKTE